ncbi:GNAT family N-acetyltransferase [Flavobacterium sp.]|uniref:GNAT family N-acetyltransferase n=1 Tax=Flavobacterium sp. TaxID=239 RepID=UPI002FDCAEFA
MNIKELTSVAEMVAQLPMMQLLYPEMTLERYEQFLHQMVPKAYRQIAVFEENTCVGLTGLWSGTKLWTGKYLEIDNFIVHPDYRKKGIGKCITDYVAKKAEESGCTCVVLDAFTANFEAQRFYYNQGYVPRGFHFIKTIDENGFS